MHRDIEFLRDVGIAVIPMAVVYALCHVEMILWPYWTNEDIHLHLLGGAAVAVGAFILWKRWTKRKWLPAIPAWLIAWTILGTVAIVGVTWEFREWVCDHYLHFGFVEQASITDTMNDLGMDLVGGIVAIALFVPWGGNRKRK